MPLYQLTPASQGSYSNWSLGAGSSKPSACNLPDDDDTSYVVTAADGQNESLVVGNKPPTLLQVNGVQGRLRGKIVDHVEGGYDVRVAAAFTTTLGGLYSAALPDGSYGNIQGAVGRPGGGTWAPSDIDNPNLAVAFDKQTGADGTARVTTSYLEVDGIPAAGGLLPYFFAVAPLIGAGLTLAHMPGLARAMFARHRVTYRPFEYADLLLAFGKWKRTEYLFLRAAA